MGLEISSIPNKFKPIKSSENIQQLLRAALTDEKGGEIKRTTDNSFGEKANSNSWLNITFEPLER